MSSKNNKSTITNITDSCKEKLQCAAEEEKLLKKKVTAQIIILFAGIIFALSAFRGVLNLQSSINIQGSVGAISGTTMYFTGILCGLLFTPYLLSVFGAKTCIILSQVGYVIFILGNYYPVLPIMISASAFSGMAEATLWPSANLICAYLAGRYASITGKSTEKYLSKILGEFFSAVFVTISCGGMISFIILHVMNHHHHGYHIEDFNTTDASTNVNIEYCGAKDCQDPNITQSNIDHYVPSKLTIYLLLTVYMTMAITGIAIHAKFLTMVPLSSHKAERRLSEMEGGKRASKFNVVRKTFKQITNPLQVMLLPLSCYVGLKSGFMTSEYTRAFIACFIGVENVGLLFFEYGIGGCVASYLSKKWSTRTQRNLTILSILILDALTFSLMLYIEFKEDGIWIIHLLAILQGVTLAILVAKSNLMCAIYFDKKQHESAYTVWNLSIVAGLMLQFGLSTHFCMHTKLYMHIGILVISVLLYGFVDVIFYRTKGSLEIDKEEIVKVNCGESA